MESHTTNKLTDSEGQSRSRNGKDGHGECCGGHAKLYAEIIACDKSFLLTAHIPDNSEQSVSASQAQQGRPRD